jgi:hypothetical protein
MTEDTKNPVVKPTLKKTAAVSLDPELLKKHQQMVNFVRNEVSTIEVELKKMKVILDQLTHFDPVNPKSLEVNIDTQDVMQSTELSTYSEEGVEVIEGVFDGYFMVGGDQKKYPVPMNYSSKTKLIP